MTTTKAATTDRRTELYISSSLTSLVNVNTALPRRAHFKKASRQKYGRGPAICATEATLPYFTILAGKCPLLGHATVISHPSKPRNYTSGGQI